MTRKQTQNPHGHVIVCGCDVDWLFYYYSEYNLP